MRVVIDSNIWISFAIGKQLRELEQIFTNSDIQIFVCDKLLKEVAFTLEKPKMSKYVTNERKKVLLKYMASCFFETIEERITRSRDPKDDFLLDLAEAVNADFLITGDSDLLVLKQHLETQIITFGNFQLVLKFM